VPCFSLDNLVNASVCTSVIASAVAFAISFAISFLISFLISFVTRAATCRRRADRGNAESRDVETKRKRGGNRQPDVSLYRYGHYHHSRRDHRVRGAAAQPRE
jgi:hypothetical protein